MEFIIKSTENPLQYLSLVLGIISGILIIINTSTSLFESRKAVDFNFNNIARIMAINVFLFELIFCMLSCSMTIIGMADIAWIQNHKVMEKADIAIYHAAYFLFIGLTTKRISRESESRNEKRKFHVINFAMFIALYILNTGMIPVFYRMSKKTFEPLIVCIVLLLYTLLMCVAVVFTTRGESRYKGTTVIVVCARNTYEVPYEKLKVTKEYVIIENGNRKRAFNRAEVREIIYKRTDLEGNFSPKGTDMDF